MQVTYRTYETEGLNIQAIKNGKVVKEITIESDHVCNKFPFDATEGFEAFGIERPDEKIIVCREYVAQVVAKAKKLNYSITTI